MTDMNARMRLTLENLASGPLEAFVDQLKGLEAIAKSVNGTLAPLARLLRQTGESASSGAGGLGKFSDAMNVMGTRLEGLETKLGASVDGLAQFGAMAREAAGAIQQAAAAITSATAAMDLSALSAERASTGVRNLGASAAVAKGELTAMSGVMKDMVGLFAAFETFKGIKASVHSGADLATLQAQMRLRGATQAQIDSATKASYADAKAFPLASVSEAMHARLALMVATGGRNPDAYGPVLQQIMQNAKAYQLNFNKKASLGDIIGNMGGLAEIRGLSQTPQGLLQASDDALRTAEATSGRMKIGAQEVVARQYKYGGANLMSSTGYYRLMALAEQQTLAGHEGGGGGGRGVSMTGTAAGMVLKLMNGGTMAKQTYDMFRAMNMFAEVGKRIDTATTSTYTSGRLIGAISGQTDPAEWVRTVLVPHMISLALANKSTYFPHGNINDPTAQKQALNAIATQTFGKTGGVNVANFASQISNPQIWDRIEKTMQIAQTAPTGSAALAKSSPYDIASAKLAASIDTLKTTIGQQLVPQVTKLADDLSRVVGAMDRFAERFPTLTKYMADLAGVLGALVAINIVARFLGLAGTVGRVTGIFGVLRGSTGVLSEAGLLAARRVDSMGVEIAGTGGVLREAFLSLRASLMAFVSAIPPMIQRLGAAVAAFGAGYAAGTAIYNHMSHKTQDAIGGTEATVLSWFGIKTPTYYTQAPWHMPTKAQDAWFAAHHPAAAPGGASMPAGEPSFSAPGLPPAHKLSEVFAATHHALRRKAPSMQDLASQWGMQDLHRAARQATSHSEHWSRRVESAQHAVQSANAKDTPEGVRAKWQQYASVLAASGHPDLAAQAQAVGERQATKLQLHQAQKHLSDLQGNLHNEVQTNAALVTAGVLTKDQAQQKTLAEQRAAAPGLIAAAQQVQALANAAGDQGLAGKMAALIPQFQALGNGLTQFQQKIANVGQGAFQNFFSAMMRGQETWRQMGHNFVANILNGMNHAMSQDLASGLVNALTGSNTSTGKALRGVGSSGGFIGSMVQSMFGTKGGAASSATSSGGIFASIGTWLSHMGSSFANGIDYVPHDMVAQIHQGEMVVPAAGAAALRAGAMGGHQVHLSIHAMDSQSVMQALHPLQRELAQMLGGANQNLNLGAY